MRNSLKVAKWEIKKNMKNKSFLISLILTPILFIAFATLPNLMSKFSKEDNPVKVYVLDEVGIMPNLEQLIKTMKIKDWKLEQTKLDEVEMLRKLRTSEKSVYISLTETAIQEGKIKVFASEDIDKDFISSLNIIQEPLRQLQLAKLGLTDKQMKVVIHGIGFEQFQIAKEMKDQTNGSFAKEADKMKRIIPGAFAGIILFSIVMTGMMIFQSASQEKKEKVAEIILSSLTPADLMQGKIIGYFVLGMTQVIVWLGFAIPLVIWKFDIPVLDYLLVPETLLLLFIAIAGYLLFAAIFVGMGATVEDMATAGNFQGFIFMLPFIPFMFIGPIISDPNGMIAKVATYIPITTPSVLLIRLSMLEKWPWIEIGISLIILLISIWLCMKLAGKIFKIGILMYGKNATPKEIWKWIRA